MKPLGHYNKCCCLPSVGLSLKLLIFDALEVTVLAICLFFLPTKLTIQSSFFGGVLLYFVTRRGTRSFGTLHELFSDIFFHIKNFISKKDCSSCANNLGIVADENMKALEQEAELYRQLPSIPTMTIELSLKEIMNDPKQKEFFEDLLEKITKRISDSYSSPWCWEPEPKTQNNCPE